MKVEGDAPDPETVAIPEVAADKTLQVKEADAVSTSVAFNSGAAHVVGFPSSDIETDKGPVPCVITGGSLTASNVDVNGDGVSQVSVGDLDGETIVPVEISSWGRR